jgi:hypothetical protein
MTATRLSLEEVKALHEIVASEDDGIAWLLDRMAELKAAIPKEDRSQRMQKELQACEEFQWRQTVALVNLALRFHCSP